nr:PTS transporter subunit EIIC [Listeria fleischmannii]
MGTAQLQNITAAQEKVALPFDWVRGSFDAYVWMGGSGGTIVLIVALLLFSKRADSRTVAKLSLGPGIFNINEPIMFGLPIVLNTIYLIPFVIAPMVMVTIAYFATTLGIVGPVKAAVPWVMPPLFNSFVATGGDWVAPIISLINMIVAFLIWTPFVLTANRVGIPEEEMKV